MESIPAYYDALASDYDQSRFGNAYGQFIHQQERQALAKLLRDTPPSEVLDLACGTGRLLEFAETGCDLSPKMIAEAHRVLRPGGRLIFDFPSEKRRRFTRGHHNQHWHGSNALTKTKVLEWSKHPWQITASQGVVFFPIHRVPVTLRPYLLPLDTILCRSFLQEYASYVLVCMQKT